MKSTTEKLVSETILQDSIPVEVNGKTYKVAPPTTATLIEVSKFISQLPEIKIKDDQNLFHEVVSFACDCEYYGDIAAILVLGKKNLVGRKEITKSRLFGLIKNTQIIEVDNQKVLAEEILLNLSAKDLNDLIIAIFQTMGVGFFFNISIFLREANLLRKTRT